jgi:hypothetical protein
LGQIRGTIESEDSKPSREGGNMEVCEEVEDRTDWIS